MTDHPIKILLTIFLLSAGAGLAAVNTVWLWRVFIGLEIACAIAIAIIMIWTFP